MSIDALAVLWRLAAYLGAIVVVTILAYIVYCFIYAIVKQIITGGNKRGRK